MAQQNLQMTRNNDYSASFQVLQNGTAVNLTGGTLRMTAKWKYSDLDASAVFQISSPSSGITVTDAANGKANFTIARAKTTSLPSHQVNLYYDLQLTDSNSNK